MARLRHVSQIPAAKQYLDRIGAKSKQIMKAEVAAISPFGYDKPTVSILFARDGEITLKPPIKDHEPTDSERAAIKDAFKGVEFVHTSTATGLSDSLRRIDSHHRFISYDISGKNILAVTERIDPKEPGGAKTYITWTPIEDGSWDAIEPDEGVPLFGLEQIKPGITKNIMLHEGGKAARAAQAASKDPTHPWYETMRHYVHLGWQGGAERPFATDWSVLKTVRGIETCIIVPDNDEPGRAAIKGISKKLPDNMLVASVCWSKEFPERFDCGDPEKIPESIINERWQPINNVNGATWATNKRLIPGEKKPLIVVRDIFAKQWAYITLNDMFISLKFPGLRMTSEEFDKHHVGFSDIKKISELMRGNKYLTTAFNTTYMPGAKNIVLFENGITSLNVYMPSHIKPRKGDISPWIAFNEHLFPNADERQHMLDYLATLIARPQNRPGYGVLLRSDTQGVGKGTLIELCEVLIGKHNCSSPSAYEIVESQFNDWISYKLLISCGEIYEGHNWKAGNRLKPLITDPNVRVNTKHMKQEQIPNFAWFMICSNDELPIKIEETDRRWFVPELTEDCWTQEKWELLRQWFRNEGASAILYWAQNYERSYLKPGHKVMQTERKSAIISQSESEEVKTALEILQTISEQRERAKKGGGFIFEMRDLRDLSQSRLGKGDYTLTANAFGRRIAKLAKLKTPNKTGNMYVRKAGGTVRVWGYRVDSFTNVDEDFVPIKNVNMLQDTDGVLTIM